MLNVRVGILHTSGNGHIHIPYIIFTSVFNVVCVTHFSVVFLKITFGEPQLI